MTKAQSVKRGITSLALLSALAISGCSSSDPNANLPSAVKTAGVPDQPSNQMYKQNTQTGPEILMSAGQNNGSYNNMRRSVTRGALPEKNGIKLTEWVNFFPYDYPQPRGRIPFSAMSETSQTPWNQNTKLLRIAVKADDVKAAERPAANLVIFVGTDGSDLALIRQSLTRLAEKLTKQDTLSIITASGDKGVLLAPTSGAERDKILSAIGKISSGKAGKDSERLAQAYNLANQRYIQGGINRVILAGNSGFNAGFSDIPSVQNFFSQQQGNISLTTLGVGVSKFQPSSLAEIAYEGNGVSAYIDNIRDADKVWDQQLNSTQTHVANEFAMNVEFNPSYVKAYRLLGYQSERNNGAASKGAVVTGQTLTALYEVVPAGGYENWSGEAYGPIYTPDSNSNLRSTKEMAMVHIRYKQPSNGASQRIEMPVPATQMETALNNSSKDFRFSAAVAAFAQQLKDNGATTGKFTLNDTLKLANDGKGSDQFELRGEFIQLVEAAQNQLPSSSPIKGTVK